VSPGLRTLSRSDTSRRRARARCVPRSGDHSDAATEGSGVAVIDTDPTRAVFLGSTAFRAGTALGSSAAIRQRVGKTALVRIRVWSCSGILVRVATDTCACRCTDSREGSRASHASGGAPVRRCAARSSSGIQAFASIVPEGTCTVEEAAVASSRAFPPAAHPTGFALAGPAQRRAREPLPGAMHEQLKVDAMDVPWLTQAGERAGSASNERAVEMALQGPCLDAMSRIGVAILSTAARQACRGPSKRDQIFRHGTVSD
jgi:hypothetical protein